MSDSTKYFAIREMLGLPANECLGECSRCGGSGVSLLQVRYVGHQCALCWGCLTAMAAHVAPVPGERPHWPRLSGSVQGGCGK